MSAGKQFILLCLVLSVLSVKAQVPTYIQDIKPILDKNCVRCHQPGDIGAMPLTNYEEVSAYGSMIQYVTASKLMPPWYADIRYSHFSNEQVLTESDIRKISDWVSGDMPIGDTVPFDSFTIDVPLEVNDRVPDLEISMAEAFEQYGIYMDQYQVFVLPTHLEEDTWIEGIEFVAGNKKIVRFAGISIEVSDGYDSLDRWDPRYGYYSFGGLGKTPDAPFWYTWSPQQKATFYTAGTAKFLPKDARLIVHIHYGPTGRPQTDLSSIRLYFSAKKTEQAVTTIPLINPYTLLGDSLFIPADTKKTFHAAYTLPYEIQLLSLMPQANLFCRSWEVYAILPGQRAPLKLLKINDWNINWKQTYYLTDPLILPKGTVLHALAQYDSTLDNPCNPSDKPIAVSWGAHLFSELFYVHFEFTTTANAASGVKIVVPPVTSDSWLKVLLTLDKTYSYEIRICSPEQDDHLYISHEKLKKGGNYLLKDIGSLPGGNYTLQVVDDHQNIVAEEIFTKLPDKGM